MKLPHFSEPQDVVALLLRRKWWVIAPLVALSCAVALLANILPKTYVSSSLVVIRPRDVPKDLVRDLVAGTTQERLKAIEQTVLSRSNLLEMAREFEDDLVEYRTLNVE